MKISLEDLQKIKKLFRSPAMAQVIRWSKCVHSKVIWICVMNVVLVGCSLAVTLITKELVDAAITSHIDSLWQYGLMLLGLVLGQVGINFFLSLLRIRASATLQRTLQGTLIRDILTKRYANLKGYHSGELVNRIFSDAGVVRSGVLGVLPGIISTLVSFIGAAAILIALDWRFVLLLAAAGLIGSVIVLLFRKPMK